MPLNLILARAANGVIGRDNALPWPPLPEDMAHFRRCTSGCAVLMGRRTWDSLPPRFRPLPGRRNLVLTRQAGWSAPGAECVASFDAALALLAPDEETWVIGGADIYAQALPWARRAVITEIGRDFEGDAHAPILGPEWQELSREPQLSSTGLPFSFVTYQKGA
ncbi:MAG: dihydrofolate reductase [Curvibacter sp.]|nr:dihydrofolate reductase [Curvibacter sp.]